MASFRTILAFVIAAAFGAAVGNGSPGDAAPYDWAKWSTFWAFKPVVKPAVPATPAAAHPIDAFIRAKLLTAGLAPAPEADKLTLLRRATFDLIGLPPTAEEIRAFQADASPDAYDKLIDRLLASPHYGERWGRHWLDVARYTPGRVSFPGVKNAAGDSHYRDYVVRSFNADKPYDRFVTEQLAGDLLPPPASVAAGGAGAGVSPADRQAYFDQLVAPAFLSIGSWFDMETDPNRLRLEMVDEMVNTTTKAFLGVSVACARCHDHKFDPIPTSDYYALGGIFRSTRVLGELNEFWRDGRVRQLRPLAMPAEVTANDAIRKRVTDLKAARWALLTARHAELSAKWKAAEPAYSSATAALAVPFSLVFEAENFDGQGGLRIAQIRKGDKATDVLETQTPGNQYVRFRLDVPDTGKYRLEALHSTDDRTPLTVTFNGDTASTTALAEPTGGWDTAYQRWDTVATGELRAGVNFIRLAAKAGNFPCLDRLRLAKVHPAFDARVSEAAKENGLDPAILTLFARWPQEPMPTIADVEAYLSPSDRDEAKRLATEADAVAATIKPYPLAVAVTDEAKPADMPVHLRGNTYRTSAEAVHRGLPQFLDAALSRPAVPSDASGRLELARWMTDRRNPLTSRVMVNRVWAWHFGRGIVDSPSDFGSRGSAPSHPELLDWLAATFVEQGWSVKQLHRLIMTSATYKHAADKEPAGSVPGSNADAAVTSSASSNQQPDPDNRLLSHFPRHRLEAEALFDAMLSTTNNLPRQPAGQPVDVAKSGNRAMYVLTTGRSPKNLGPDVRKMLTLFDVDMTGQPVEARRQSATPAQSLFWLNSPLVTYFADGFATRLLKMDQLTDTKRVEMMYLLAVGRPPSRPMAEQAYAFLEQCKADGDEPQQAWTKLCQALYASAEFRYVE